MSMELLLENVEQRISKVLVAVVLSLALGCNHRLVSTVHVSPTHFKVQIPFILNERGIIVNTYWGSSRVHHVLCLDNYSPSWIHASAIQPTLSFKQSNDLKFKTSTADGSPVQGAVGVCDSLFLTVSLSLAFLST